MEGERWQVLDEDEAVVRAGRGVRRDAQRGQELPAGAAVELVDGRRVEAEGLARELVSLVIDQHGRTRGTRAVTASFVVLCSHAYALVVPPGEAGGSRRGSGPPAAGVLPGVPANPATTSYSRRTTLR